MGKVMKGIGTAVSLGVGVAASAVLIAMGLIYFVIALWIVKLGALSANYDVSANWAVLSATLLSVGSMIGSAIKK